MFFWNTEQLSNCKWFIAKSGFDTADNWNAFLGEYLVDGTNLGSADYPFRTWDITQTDSRVVQGDWCAVSLGMWGSDAVRASVTKKLKFIGQSGTVVDMQAASTWILKLSTSDYEEAHNISFINGEYSSIVSGGTIVNDVRKASFINCAFDIFRIGSDYRTYSGPELSKCFVKQLFFNGAYYAAAYLDRCTVLKSEKGTINGAKLYAESSIIFENIGCNIQSSYYNCIPSYSGGWETVTADPQWNNPATGDYSLSSNSPCLYAGKGQQHIGCYGEALSLTPNSIEFTEPNAVFSKSDGVNNDIIKEAFEVDGITYFFFRLADSKTSGWIETDWIFHGKIRKIDSIRMIADMFFDADGNYSQAVSSSLNKLTVQMKTAVTDVEKGGAAFEEIEWSQTGLNKNTLWSKYRIDLVAA